MVTARAHWRRWHARRLELWRRKARRLSETYFCLGSTAETARWIRVARRGVQAFLEDPR